MRSGFRHYRRQIPECTANNPLIFPSLTPHIVTHNIRTHPSDVCSTKCVQYGAPSIVSPVTIIIFFAIKMIFTFIALTIMIHEYFSNKPTIKIDYDDLDKIMNSFYCENCRN